MVYVNRTRLHRLWLIVPWIGDENASGRIDDPCHRRCCPGHRAAPDRIALTEYDDATGDFKGLTLPIQDRSRPPAMIPSLSALDTKAATMRRLRMRSQTSCARSSREVVRHIVSAPDEENISIVLEVSAENSDRFSENVARTIHENSRVLGLYNSDFEDVKW